MSDDRKYNVLAAVAVLAALVLPSFAALAASASEVTGRSASAIQRDYGRASGDAYWEHRETSNVPGPVIKAFEEVKDIATNPPRVWPPELQRYGRAGGYLESDKLQAESQHG